MKAQSKYTIAGYRDALNSFVRFTGAADIRDLTIPRIEEWIAAGTTQKKWSPVTSRGRIRYMILFAKWLVTRKALPENPLEGVGLPRIPKKIPRHLSIEDAEHLLRVLRNCRRFRSRFEGHRAYAIIALFMFTGIRKYELRKLELSDVDLEGRVLSIRGGKGAKDRLVALPPQLIEALGPYLKLRDTPRFSGTPYFFAGLQGGMLADKVLRRTIQRAREASGIYFAPHMLRHTYATLMLEGGCDLFSLSKLMGHADIKTTAIYLSASVKHLHEQVLKHPVAV